MSKQKKSFEDWAYPGLMIFALGIMGGVGGYAIKFVPIEFTGFLVALLGFAGMWMQKQGIIEG